SATATNVNFNVSLGGSIVCTCAATAQSGSKTNIPFHIKIFLACKSTGSSGTCESGGVFTNLGTTTFLSQGLLNFSNGTSAGVLAPTVPPTVNWTTSLLMDFSVTYNNATAGNITVCNL